MLLLTCPYCGQRAQIEFRCGGASDFARPEPSASDTQWAEYLFHRRNPDGITFERWLHVAGCRQWFSVARHTGTHAVLAVYEMGAARPVLPA